MSDTATGKDISGDKETPTPADFLSAFATIFEQIKNAIRRQTGREEVSLGQVDDFLRPYMEGKKSAKEFERSLLTDYGLPYEDVKKFIESATQGIEAYDIAIPPLPPITLPQQRTLLMDKKGQVL